MATRNVVLTDHLEQVANYLVLSGRCQNASEVQREALRLLERRKAEETAKLEALRCAASTGLTDLGQGRFIEVGSDDLGDFLAEVGNEAAGLAGEKH